MMSRSAAVPLLLALVCVLLAGLALHGEVAGYAAQLRVWHANVRQNPEGPTTAALFDAALSQGAIAWNPNTGHIDRDPLVRIAELEPSGWLEMSDPVRQGIHPCDLC